MTYRYLDKIRFQAFFDSPNECAAVIVIFLGLLLGIILHFKKQDNKIAKPAFYFSSLLFVISTYYLFLTYSRGGFVAFFLGLLFFVTITKQWNKKILLSLTGLSTFFLLSVPNLFVRIIGSINIFSDASIGNRLKLWKGCLAIFADHWFSGVGFDLQLGDYFTGWYQPQTMNPT